MPDYCTPTIGIGLPARLIVHIHIFPTIDNTVTTMTTNTLGATDTMVAVSTGVTTRAVDTIGAIGAIGAIDIAVFVFHVISPQTR
jgi:voltage-gated potassium channel Kch